MRELAKFYGKHEETIKRWLRAGKFPNAYRLSDKEGWRIPEVDLQLSHTKKEEINPTIQTNESRTDTQKNKDDDGELINLAYQAVTLTMPSKEIIDILSMVGIKRTLEILLIMQQSATKVKNPDGFIKKAIRENWNPSTIPIKLPKKKSKRLIELTNQDYENMNSSGEEKIKRDLPFYNWLED